MPVNQHVGSEGKAGHMFKVTFSYKSEVNLGY